MLKLAALAVLIGVSGVIAYDVYDQYRGGYFTRPDMPEGAFSISYKSGLRAILVDIPDERETRRYLGLPHEVPFYLEDAWSFCRAPREDEQQHVSEFMAGSNWPGARFEALCEIEVDEEAVVRGVIVTVPKV